MATTARKLNPSQQEFQQVIAKHDQLLENWRAYRSKQETESQTAPNNVGPNNQPITS